MKSRLTHLTLLAWLSGALLIGIFAVMVVNFRSKLREEIHQTIINRDAAVLRPVALRQLAQREATADSPDALLAAVLESAQQDNMLAVAIFDAQGRAIGYAPDSLLFAELPLDDYFRLLKAEPISRFHPEFPLDRYFSGIGHQPICHAAPVLEVLLPLHARTAGNIIGFAQYYIDARSLSAELAAIDQRNDRLTAATLGIGAALIAAVIAAAYFILRRAERAIAERNERLVRANFELTLAAKTSALGQITSHLIHGLQGSVAGLRAVVTDRNHGRFEAADWETAAEYTDDMQAMIQETMGLLGDSSTHSSYELTGHELANIILRRNKTAAEQKGIIFAVSEGFDEALDGHRGGLLCLIINNLVHNALHATDAGRRVEVLFHDDGDNAMITVLDEGHGVPEEVRAHLFEPGRSGQNGGSGLGLALSQLIARQIGATLRLAATGPKGTSFRLTLPHKATEVVA